MMMVMMRHRRCEVEVEITTSCLTKRFENQIIHPSQILYGYFPIFKIAITIQPAQRMNDDKFDRKTTGGVIILTITNIMQHKAQQHTLGVGPNSFTLALL